MKLVTAVSLGLLGVIAVAVLIVLFSNSDRTEPADFSGLEAAVTLLQGYDYLVEQSSVLPEPADDEILILVGWWIYVTDQELLEHVEQGGDVILVGEHRGLPDGITAVIGQVSTRREQGKCTIPALLDTGVVHSAADSLNLRIEAGDLSCFGSDDYALVVQREMGRGTITWIGDSALIANSSIALFENAELLVRLVGEHERVVIGDERMVSGAASRQAADDSAAPSGKADELFDLLPGWVVLALWQLLGAFAVFVWLRSRRLGDPVDEQLPVELPAAELARSTGRLFQRSGVRDLPLSLLRRSFREDCAKWVGLAPDANADAWVAAVKRRTDSAEFQIREVLYTGRPYDDASLLDYSKKIDSLREECMR